MTTTKINVIDNRLKKNFNFNLIIDTIFTISIFLIMLLIIASPKRYTEGTVSGLKLFIFSVMPGLFPFMLLTKLLTELGTMFKLCGRFDKISKKLFGTPGISLYAFFMSILSGYPIGAKIIADLYDKQLISENDAKKMSVFCTTSGPIFVIGTVGVIMFNSYLFGIILYASHILSSLLLGIIFNLFSKKDGNLSKNEKVLQFSKRDNIVSFCVSETINSIFIVGAYITIFYLISELFESIGVFNILNIMLKPIFEVFKIDANLVQGLSYGLIEVTRGVKVLSGFGTTASLVLASGVLSFSGLSIIFQSMAFLKRAKIKTHTFVLYKLVHFIFAMLICFVLCIIILWWLFWHSNFTYNNI